MPAKKGQTPDLPAPEDFTVTDGIPSDADDRDELVSEQQVQMAEQAALDAGVEPDKACKSCEAMFVTKAALDAHAASFHPSD